MFSAQLTEYNPNINFKIWRVYPTDSDTLNLDHKDWAKGRANKARPYFFAKSFDKAAGEVVVDARSEPQALKRRHHSILSGPTEVGPFPKSGMCGAAEAAPFQGIGGRWFRERSGDSSEEISD